MPSWIFVENVLKDKYLRALDKLLDHRNLIIESYQ
jgi:hypothetical protein